MQWFPRESSPITHATYSCDGQSIYVSFEDGSVGVLTASTLRLRCRINSTAYLPSNPRFLFFYLFIYLISSLGFLMSLSPLFRRLTIPKTLLVFSAWWCNFNSLRVYPLVIAAHPSEPDQFALGLTDGGIHVFEPLESEGKWGTSPPVENGAGPSTASGAAGSEQAQR